MTKTEAAELLGVSEKTVSRYVSSGKLPARYIQGKTGKQLNFERDDLEAFKVESAKPVEVGQGETTALVPALPSVPANVATAPQGETFADLVRAIVAETGQDKSTVQTSEKLTLSLDEAAALSGVPRSVLDAGRKDGSLGARKIGRGYRVQRGDLETFVASLFDGK